MNRLKVFIPSIIGIIIFISSFFVTSMLDSNIEADKHLVSNIEMLLDHQTIDSGAEKLINGSVHSLMENNHLLLLQLANVISVIGLGLLLLLFPYSVAFRFGKKKI